MRHDPFKDQLRQAQADRNLTDQFRRERLSREGLSKDQWPAQIDNAALDVLGGVAIGSLSQSDDIGGTIGRDTFPEATGPFYREGLQAVVGPDSPTASAISRFEGERLSRFGFRLNELRETLRKTDSALDIDRALEAILEKTGTRAAAADPEDVPAGLPNLRDSESAADLILRLFADPELEAYGEDLIGTITSGTVKQSTLVEILDRPQMTTPLWEHQREALRDWYQAGQSGYVDMATATGKTVLGIAAMAVRYGRLHPEDQELVTRGEESDRQSRRETEQKPRILVVASNEVILDQWQKEFDAHLDIPRARTRPTMVNGRKRIDLSWATIEFATAPALLEAAVVEPADLILLDEAHQYSRGGQGATRRWGDLFVDLVENSAAILAMSGSVDEGWQGDSAARKALETHLERRKRYTLAEARQHGVIADFEWSVHYAPVSSDGEDKLAAQTRITTQYHDAASGELDTEGLDITLPADQPNDFPTYTSLRSFIQSSDGRQLRDNSDRFDLFSAAVQTRQPLIWNLTPMREHVVSIVADNADRQCVVLVQSYEEAIALGEQLRSDDDADEVIVLESREDDRTAKIRAFNETPGATIIGPGRLLGTGVDMPDAEVAVNVAKGGVTAELVQRIGRVLRNPDGSKEARFYHVVPQPQTTDALVPAEDGRELLTRAAEFQALGETIDERPTFTSVDSLRSVIGDLERYGAAHLREFPELLENVDPEKVRMRLDDIRAAIEDADSTDGSFLLASNPWRRDEAEPAHAGSGIEGGPEEIPDPERSELSEADRAEVRSLERVACNDAGGETAEAMQLTAVKRLATFDRAALESLDRIADETNCQSARVRAAAEQAIEAILHDRE